MCHRIFFLLLYFQLLSTVAFSQDTLSVDLTEAVEYAIHHNENIAQVLLSMDITEEQFQIALGNYLPNLSIGSDYTRNIKLPVFFLPENSPFGGGTTNGGGPRVLEVGSKNAFAAGLQGNLPIFNKVLLSGVKAARISRQLNQMNLRAEINEVTAQVRTAFFNALIAQRLLEVQELRLITTQDNLNIISSQFREGLVAEYDYLRAQVNVENIRPNLIEIQNNSNSIINNLKVVMGLPMDQPIELKGSLEDYSEIISTDVLDKYSVSKNPNLLAVLVQEELQQVQVDVQRSYYFPSLNGFGNYNYQAQENDFNFSQYRWVETSAVGLSLNWNIFQGLILRNRVQIERINAQILNKQYNFLHRSLQAQANNASNTIERTLVNILAQESNVALAERAYSIGQIRYLNGVANLLELNDAELAMAEARVNYLSSIQQYLTALVEFQRLVGEDIIDFTAR